MGAGGTRSAVSRARAWAGPAFWLYLLVLVVIEATAANPADPDLWHRLALGETLWTTGHLPTGDTFSYLADYREIADHEWGSGVLFFAAWSLGGGAAMVLIKTLTLGATLVLLARAGLGERSPSAGFTAFLALILLALLPSFQSTVRCMVFTNLFFALWLYWYRREGTGRAVATWLYPATMLLWANLHGGFVLGLAWLAGVAGLHFRQPALARRWAARFGLCLLATLINPYGFHLWISTARALAVPRGGFGEWEPVNWIGEWSDYAGYKLLVLATLGALLWLAVRRPAAFRRWRSVAYLAGALALSLTSARHTVLFAEIAAAFLPALWWAQADERGNAGESAGRRRARVALGAGLIVGPLLVALGTLPGAGLRLQYPAISCPVNAVTFLRQQNVRGDLLVPFNYGSYALWELRGRMRVSMDGRYDLVYRAETCRRVEDFFAARGDLAGMLAAPNAVLLPLGSPVLERMKERPEWREAYADGTDAVFLRR